MTIPSISSSTTTGGAKRFGTTATVIAAIAATTTIAKKEPVSTSIAAIGRAITGDPTAGRVGSPVDRARRGISGAL